MKVFKQILEMPKPAYFILIDPDKMDSSLAANMVVEAQESGISAVLLGSSILLDDGLNSYIKKIKAVANIPLIIFPGILNSISANADAILFLNMLSSRNPQLLIGEQVRAAPLIKKHSLEPISTGYLLIESGNLTSVQYMSNSLPIPSDKPDIVVAHALAAEFMGMKMLYLEAGSGALRSVPDKIISAVKAGSSLPLIVGGGIRSSEDALSKVEAGADIIVTGTILENKNSIDIMKDISKSLQEYRKKNRRGS